jgi:Rne/Rng family ribonuclease
VRVDSRETFDRILDFAGRFMPDLAERVEHYPGERPIFDLYGVEDEIQRALRKEVPLKSGGYLIVDQTEAMTTIDVNTGGFLGTAISKRPSTAPISKRPRRSHGSCACATSAASSSSTSST